MRRTRGEHRCSARGSQNQESALHIPTLTQLFSFRQRDPSRGARLSGHIYDPTRTSRRVARECRVLWSSRLRSATFLVQGLLVVNADDLGSDVHNTDAILTCFQAGAISSSTAMVFMADSERAAGLARSHDLPTGLHLNLTMRYTAPGAPTDARRRQSHVVDLFAQARQPHRAWRPAKRLIGACVEDQLDEFRRLYGREPTHVDGHNHAHLSANVLLSRALPSGLQIGRAHV